MLLVSARKASKVLAQVGLDLEAAATR
jgi:hypothetical protein